MRPFVVHVGVRRFARLTGFLKYNGRWEDSFLSDLVMAIVLSVAVRHLGPLGRGRGPRGGVLGRHAPQRLAGRRGRGRRRRRRRRRGRPLTRGSSGGRRRRGAGCAAPGDGPGGPDDDRLLEWSGGVECRRGLNYSRIDVMSSSED